MDKQKAIEDMENIIDRAICQHNGVDCSIGKHIAIDLYLFGYGNIEKACKETAKEILQDLKGLLEGYIDKRTNETLYEQKCKKYGVDAE